MGVSKRRSAAVAGCLAAAAVAAALLLAASRQARPAGEEAAGNWPQWRGPNRSAVTQESSGYPRGWPPTRLWRRNVGAGCTSPIVAGGRVYVMGWRGRRDKPNPVGADTVYCFDALTGREIWKQSYRCRYQGRLRTGDTERYGGPSATPAFDEQTGLLFTLSIDGDLRCWEATNRGRPVWAKNLHDEYQIARRPDVGRGVRDYGFTGSPLVLGRSVIVEVGSSEGTLMAFDTRTGIRRWTSVLADPAGHTSGPTVIMLGSEKFIVTLTLNRLAIIGAEGANRGLTIAQYPRRTDFGCNIATPAVAGRKIALTSSYNQMNTELIEIGPDGPRRKWRSKSHALLSSPVIYKDRVFIMDKSVKCLDLERGTLKWQGGAFGHGSCVVTAGDDKLIVFGRGRLVLLEARPKDDRYTELARVTRVVPGVCYPQVVFTDGLICCKDKDGELVVLSVRLGRSEKR